MDQYCTVQTTKSSKPIWELRVPLEHTAILSNKQMVLTRGFQRYRKLTESSNVKSGCWIGDR